MENLQLTKLNPPTVLGQTVVETNTCFYETNCGQFSVKQNIEKYENGIQRVINFKFDSPHSTFYFEQLLKEGNLREYRKWYKNGEKREHYFYKIIKGERVKDGPYQSWYVNYDNFVKTEKIEYYIDGKLTMLCDYSDYRAKRLSKIYTDNFVEILEEHRDNKWKYSIEESS